MKGSRVATGRCGLKSLFLRLPGFVTAITQQTPAPGEQEDDLRQHRCQQDTVQQMHHGRDVLAINNTADHLDDGGNQHACCCEGQDVTGGKIDI